jgi:predicted RNA binding protein YcfA (HicA-like mRNA interferase family)
MKAITTTYHGPTYSRGSRIVASEPDGKRITVSYNAALNSDKNHAAAAIALLERLGWTGTLQGGSTKAGMVWCFIDHASQITFK